MADVTVTIDRRAVNALFYRDDGPVQEDTRKKAEKTATLARSLAPRGKTGRLQKSILTKPFESGSGKGWSVIANTDYAFYVHEGAARHTFGPRRARYLRFYWEKADPEQWPGKVVYFKKVNHPGIEKPQPFLVLALRQVI
jgi:hypothetical protein